MTESNSHPLAFAIRDSLAGKSDCMLLQPDTGAANLPWHRYPTAEDTIANLQVAIGWKVPLQMAVFQRSHLLLKRTTSFT